MDRCTCLVLFAFSFSALIAGCDAGAVKIQICRDGFIDVKEGVTNSITCTDFADTDTITWTITKDGVSTDVATCTPSGCTNHSSDVGAVREAGNKTQLLYPSRDREKDGGTSVSCTSNKSQKGHRTTSCTLNVISPAILSLCGVQLDETNWTVTGGCHFDHAFASNRGFRCVWYRSSPGQNVSSLGGQITSKSSSGECAFAASAPKENGNYTFSVDFYPSAGVKRVKTVTIQNGTRGSSASQPTVIEGTGRSTSPPEQSKDLPLGGIVGGAVAAVAVLVVVVVVVIVIKRRQGEKHTGVGHGKDTDQKDDAEEHVNPLYGTGASLDTPPQPRPKPAGLALRIPSATNSADLDSPAPAGESPALRGGGRSQGDGLPDDAADFRSTGIAFSGRQTATSATPAARKALVVDSSSRGAAASRGASSASAGPGSGGFDPAAAPDVDLYASADGDSPGSSRGVPGSSRGPPNVAQDFDAYAIVDDANGQTAAPQRDTYAVVNKSGPRATPTSTASGARSADNGSRVDDSYANAVVNKDRSGRNAGIASTRPAPRAGEDVGGQAEPSRDVYALVDKTAKRSNSRPSAQATAEPETEAYAQVQKPKPGVKPKPKPKPKSALRPNSPDAAGPWSRDNGYEDISPHASGGLQEGMTQNTSGDVYNTLSYSKQASLPEPADPDPQYSHIGHA